MPERETLEQMRARDAWDCVAEARKELSPGEFENYVSDAKGLAALIMNSGLMQVMAYLRDKGWDSKKKEEKRQEVLARQLRAWLGKRFSVLPDEPKDFESFMEKLMGADAREYQEITAEAFAWLRWLRQMAAARQGED